MTNIETATPTHEHMRYSDEPTSLPPLPESASAILGSVYGVFDRKFSTTQPERPPVAQNTSRPPQKKPAPTKSIEESMQDGEDWQIFAACRNEDPDHFFHPEGERGSSRTDRIEGAKAICATCPVIAKCGEVALANRETYGVWGGMSEDEREAIINRRSRVKIS